MRDQLRHRRLTRVGRCEMGNREVRCGIADPGHVFCHTQQLEYSGGEVSPDAQVARSNK